VNKRRPGAQTVGGAIVDGDGELIEKEGENQNISSNRVCQA